MNHFRRRSI